MAYTGHGHQVPGTPSEGTPPQQVSNCGGVGKCSSCTSDAFRARTRWKEYKKIMVVGCQFHCERLCEMKKCVNRHRNKYSDNSGE